MRPPSWAAAWWQRRQAAAAERRLARALGLEGRWRARVGPPRPAEPIATVELRGGSRDGQLYRLPASYRSSDGLPDAIAISNAGRPEIYYRDRDAGPRHYHYRPAPPRGAARR